MISQQMITLIVRTRARLDVDISKVRKLQGEPPLNEVNTRAASSQNSNGFGLNSNAAMEISESLRSVMLPTAAPSPAVEESRQSPVAVALPTATAASGAATKSQPSLPIPLPGVDHFIRTPSGSICTINQTARSFHVSCCTTQVGSASETLTPIPTSSPPATA